VPAFELSFAALVEATGATVASERGQLNVSLKAIREEEPELSDEELALVIKYRGEDYRRLWPQMACTPTALAKHWVRIREELTRSKTPPSPAETPVYLCKTCGGDRIVVVAMHASKNPNSQYEECAPCPDCGTGQVVWWRHDGTRRATPEPEDVRRRISE